MVTTSIIAIAIVSLALGGAATFIAYRVVNAFTAVVDELKRGMQRERTSWINTNERLIEALRDPDSYRMARLHAQERADAVRQDAEIERKAQAAKRPPAPLDDGVEYVSPDEAVSSF